MGKKKYIITYTKQGISKTIITAPMIHKQLDLFITALIAEGCKNMNSRLYKAPVDHTFDTI